MSRLPPKKMIIWLLAISCFISYGGGLGQAVICSDQQSQVVAFELFHDDHHCAAGHRHHGHERPDHDNTVKLAQGDNCFTVCNNIEVSLQLFASRRTTIKSKAEIIAKPIFKPSTFTHTITSSPQFSFSPKPPLVPTPSLALLKSVILLI